MRPADRPLANSLRKKFISFSNNNYSMSAVKSPLELDCLIEQVIDSVRRIKYIQLIRNKHIDSSCADVNNKSFDPIKASSWHKKNNNIEEASWLLFLSIHFGKNGKTGWNLLKDVYGNLGSSFIWNWQNINADRVGFKKFIDNNHNYIKSRGKFGNHRKYESLKKDTVKTIFSYLDLIGKNSSHSIYFNSIKATHPNNKDAFKQLYKDIKNIFGFGRMAQFDFLCLLGKMKLIEIEPDSAYISNSTGPKSGAKLLFGRGYNGKQLDTIVTDLESSIGLEFGMQVLEDAICNWQKSPHKYIYFGG